LHQRLLWLASWPPVSGAITPTVYCSFSLADLVALSMADREAKARAAADAKLIEGDSKKVE
jgi:hypothetical protein